MQRRRHSGLRVWQRRGRGRVAARRCRRCHRRWAVSGDPCVAITGPAVAHPSGVFYSTRSQTDCSFLLRACSRERESAEEASWRSTCYESYNILVALDDM